MATTDSTWGIPKPVRTVLAARITELRVGLQEDARRQLAAWGIGAEHVGPPPGGRVLSADDMYARDIVLAVIETRRAAGVSREEALQAYLEEVAFTLLNRLVTLRCLEERGLLQVDDQPETIVRRDPVTGTSSLIWRTRSANPDLDERSVARSAYRTACAAMTDRVKVLFDPDDEASALFPTLPFWQKAVAALNDPAIPSAVFAEDEIMGWVYQYWSTELKNEVYAKLAKGGKIEDPSELAAATALYTERYIVDYLVQNTLGATWVEMHPESTLPSTWPYYVKPPGGEPAGRAGVQACPRAHPHRSLRRSRPLSRPCLRPVRPAVRRRGDRAARGRRWPHPRAQPLRRRHRPPRRPDRRPRPVRQGLCARRRRLPAAQAQPRRLRHRHPASTPRGVPREPRRTGAQGARPEPLVRARRHPHFRLAAPSRARGQRGVRQAQGHGARAPSGLTTRTGRRSAPTS